LAEVSYDHRIIPKYFGEGGDRFGYQFQLRGLGVYWAAPYTWQTISGGCGVCRWWT